MGCCSPCGGHTSGDPPVTTYCNNISNRCECNSSSTSDGFGSYSGFCGNVLFVKCEFHYPGGVRELKLLSPNSPCTCGVPDSLKTLIGRRPSDNISNFWLNSGVKNGYRFLGWDPDGINTRGSWGISNANLVFHSHWLVLPAHINEGGTWKRKGSIWRYDGGIWKEVGNRGGTVTNDIGGGNINSSGTDYYGDKWNAAVSRVAAGGQLVKHMPTEQCYKDV